MRPSLRARFDFAMRRLRGLRLTRPTMLALSLAVFGGMTVSAWWMNAAWLDRPWGDMFSGGRDWRVQVAVGLAIGVGLAAIVAWAERATDPFPEYEAKVREVFRILRPGPGALLFVSIGAGWSEELFFRGVLQPGLGLVAASVLFSLAHGPPLPPTRERLALSLFLFGGGVLLGFVCEHAGMIAAMVAHAAYDFVLLMIFRRQWLAGGVSAGAPG